MQTLPKTASVKGTKQPPSDAVIKSMVDDMVEAWKSGGIDKARELLDTLDRANGKVLPFVPPSADSPRKFYTIADLASIPPVTPLIDMIPARALSMLVGASGGGKSFVALDYSLRAAREHKRNVIYVAAEGSSGYYDRAQAWCKPHDYDGDHLLFDTQPLELRNPLLVHDFIESIKPLNPAMVVLDTLARCMLGLDENSARDMGIAVEAAATIIRETGAAVLFIHHTGKSGLGERGSSALYAACDNVIWLNNDDGLITLSHGKAKDGKLHPDRYLRLMEVQARNGQTSCVVMPSEKIIDDRRAPLTKHQTAVLEVLTWDTFLTAGIKASQVAPEAKIPQGSTYRVLTSLMKKNYIAQGRTGDPYKITPDGWSAVRSDPFEGKTTSTTSNYTTHQTDTANPKLQTTLTTHSLECSECSSVVAAENEADKTLQGQIVEGAF